MLNASLMKFTLFFVSLMQKRLAKAQCSGMVSEFYYYGIKKKPSEINPRAFS